MTLTLLFTLFALNMSLAWFIITFRLTSEATNGNIAFLNSWNSRMLKSDLPSNPSALRWLAYLSTTVKHSFIHPNIMLAMHIRPLSSLSATANSRLR